MILNNAPQTQAVLSNVGEIGEFRIRNSAKAFNILSSGLYANKVKAIIRELSCNAVDSHVAAGNTDTPFEVHLPTTLAPHFSIRDFGTGLDHDQVTNIYTTYFESTKTGSNSFIGALGLGSKSPFSYTDNFTVTAIKDGTKGIYSAFINAEGVPSIVKMGEEQTTEPSGVEIKFSVNERLDSSRFYDEACRVYRYFKLRPVFTGAKVAAIVDHEYESMNIIPGVHNYKNKTESVAVMGNIAYPISVPGADKSLGVVGELLKCGLEMHFDIGELDFQASREGLSYIPQTVDAIKRKLEQVNDKLSIFIADEADKIVNKWDRSIFLYQKKNKALWSAAVTKYVTETNFELFDVGGNSRWKSSFDFSVPIKTLNACNIYLRGFRSNPNVTKMQTLESEMDYDSRLTTRDRIWSINVWHSTQFVINDLKIGATSRAKHHYRSKVRKTTENVYVLEPLDKNKPMMIEAFKNLLANPPTNKFMFASDLTDKPRVAGKGMGKNVTIMRLEKRGGNQYRSASDDLVWRDGGKLEGFDKNRKFYYIPLLGFQAQLTRFSNHVGPHNISEILIRTGLSELQVPIYGVRKGDIEFVRTQKNWINLEEHIVDTITNLDEKVFVAGALEMVDKTRILDYNVKKIVDSLPDTSTGKKLLSNFVDVPKIDGFRYIKQLHELLKIAPKWHVDALVTKYNGLLDDFRAKYPLVSKLGSYATVEDIVSYVMLVDEVKGV